MSFILRDSGMLSEKSPRSSTVHIESKVPLINNRYFYSIYRCGEHDKNLMDQLLSRHFSVD